MQQKKRRQKKLQELAKNDDYAIYFQDEVHFKLTLTIVRAWFLAGVTPEIKSPTDRFKLSVFGAMGKNGQLITRPEAVFDAKTFKQFLQQLIDQAMVVDEKTKRRKKILLVLDNARYHHANLLKDWLLEVSDTLELFFLPPYSPDINAIEMLWKKTRRAVTHNRFFQSIDELSHAVQQFWKQFSNPNAELQKLTAFI